MVPDTIFRLRVKLSVGIGLLVVVSIGAGVALWRTAHRGAAQASRAVALSRFVEELQALDPALVKLTAVAGLVARGDGAFRDDLARQMRAVDARLAGLAQQASGLSATQWGFLNHLQQEWKSAQTAAAQLPQSVENMQRSLAVLRQDCVRALQQDASAAAAWPRRVGLRSALLLLVVVGLALLVSLPWALAVQRLSRQLQEADEREQRLTQMQQELASAQDALSSTQSELQWAQQTIVQLTSARSTTKSPS